NSAGAASAGAASSAATYCTESAVHPATMTRQIRRTGRIFFILLIADSIFASFHPLVRTRLSIRQYVGRNVLSGPRWLSHATPSSRLRTGVSIEAYGAPSYAIFYLSVQAVGGSYRQRLRGPCHGGASTELNTGTTLQLSAQFPDPLA